MPRKRKRIQRFLSDTARFAVRLTSVASDGVPVPGLKAATGGVTLLWDRFENRKGNLEDEQQARARGSSLSDWLMSLGEGQLEADELDAFRRRLERHLSKLPDLRRKSRWEQLIRTDQYARDVADCNTALDRLYRDIELALGRRTLIISQSMRAAQSTHEDTLQLVVRSLESLDRRLSESLAQRPLPDPGEELSRIERLKRKQRALIVLSSSFVLFSTQGSQVPASKVVACPLPHLAAQRY